MTLTIDAFHACPSPPDDMATLRAAAIMARVEGWFLEFGVYRGRSIRVLADTFPSRRIHGFDSFQGLPERWMMRDDDEKHVAGYFATRIPEVPRNVRLWVGWFEKTLPVWRAAHAGPVAFVHVDSDLYSSARTVLFGLTDRLVPGSVILFDELYDWTETGRYTKWKDGEWKALTEWIAQTGREVKPCLRGPRFSAAVEVV